MVMAYVLVKVEPGKESKAAQEIVKINGVREASWTYGFCDILFRIEANSIEALDKIMLNKVRRTPGVTSTETIIVSSTPIYAPHPPGRTAGRRARAKRRRA
ncbi:MAG: Lrp/AsnC ligand binding domain-containing protein [archaeon]